MKTQTKGSPITFRLYPDDENLLREHAPAGTTSLGPVAEKLLLERLYANQDDEVGFIREKVTRLDGELEQARGEIKKLRAELKSGIETVLMALVHRSTLTEENVNEWAETFGKD